MEYDVGKLVAETDNYRLYLCTQKVTGRQCLLQIATAVEHNAGLQRAAFILKELKRRADELEKEYDEIKKKMKKDPKVLLNYQLGFPELVDSFVCQEQGNRQINILAFRHVENVSKMVPLTNITEKDRLRVDLRTSAWIMGKALKMIDFVHSMRISVNPTGNNILIEPDQHYVMIFEYSKAQIHPDGDIPIETRRENISQAARAVIAALGGDFQTGIFPDKEGEATAFIQYTNHISGLARGNESNAERAHAIFYELIKRLWKREFYPFTVKPFYRKSAEQI